MVKRRMFLPNFQLFLAIMVEWWFLNEFLVTKYNENLVTLTESAIELMINKARHEIRIVNTARWP